MTRQVLFYDLALYKDANKFDKAKYKAQNGYTITEGRKMTIHIIPTAKALDSLAEIEQETGLTIGAGGEMVERPKSAFFLEMYAMTKAINELHGNPFGTEL